MSTAEDTGTVPNAIDLPYSKTTINPGEAYDHAVMRSRQLVDLLDAIGGTGPSNLMWLAQQIAHELADAIWKIESDSFPMGRA